jgi:hypothetical protein
MSDDSWQLTGRDSYRAIQGGDTGGRGLFLDPSPNFLENVCSFVGTRSNLSKHICDRHSVSPQKTHSLWEITEGTNEFHS